MARTYEIGIPLQHDHHTHVSLYAALASCPTLAGLEAKAALELLHGLPRDRLSMVTGWRTNELPLGKDALAALPPIILVNFSLHGFAFTDAAVPFAAEAVPDVLENRDDPSWREANMPRLFEAYASLSGACEASISAFMEGLRKVGIGSAEDMGVSDPLSASVIAKSFGADRVALWATPAMYAKLDPATRAQVAGLKLFLDGALGARSAAIAGGYLGEGTPILVYRGGDLLAEILALAELGKGVAIHAIGERAIEQAVDALERASLEGARFPLTRLEHVQFISKQQARRARDLGVTLSMQPNFNSDTTDYLDRLPKDVLARNNPFRMLIDECGFEPGKDLVFGSDGMPHGIAFAAKVSLFPPAPGQGMSLEELLAGYGKARGVDGCCRLKVDEREREVSLESV